MCWFDGGPSGVRLVLLDDHRDLAELDDVARPQRLLARPDPHAVDVRAVGALQVAHAPPVVGQADLGVPAADRAVVEHNLQRRRAGRPAGAFPTPTPGP